MSLQRGKSAICEKVKEKLESLGIHRDVTEDREDGGVLEDVARQTGRKMIIKTWMKYPRRRMSKSNLEKKSRNATNAKAKDNNRISHMLEMENDDSLANDSRHV